MPFVAPLAEMLLNVSPLAPMVVLETLRAVPVVESIVFGLAPVPTTIVPPPVALKPAPEVVSMSRPPFVKLMVAPELFDRFTPVPVPVLNFLFAPLKVIAFVPVLLPETEIPFAAVFGLMSPESVTVPPVLFSMFAASVLVLLIVPE